MPDVIDIIHRITYESNTDVIESLNKAFGNQFTQLKELEKEQAKLAQLISQTGAKEIQQKNLLTTALQRNKQQIDAITTSIGQEFSANERLNQSFVKATGNTRNLGFAFSQILREAPAFAFSVQTGLLGISNNIPILLDQLKAARQEGTSVTGIFKALGSSLFGLTGIITLAVSALTIFGGQLFKSGKSAKTAAEETDDYTEAIQKNIDAQNKAINDERNRQNLGANAAKRRLDLLKAQGAGEAEILAAQKAYNDELVNGFNRELDTYSLIEQETRRFFDFYGQQGLTDEETRKKVAGQLQNTLRETLGVTKETAEEEAKAIADSYNTRESIIARFIPKKRSLEEKIKDIGSETAIEEAKADKERSDARIKRLEELRDLYIKLQQEVRNFYKLSIDGGSPTRNINALGFEEEPTGTAFSGLGRATPEERAAFNQAQIEVDTQKRVTESQKEEDEKQAKFKKDALDKQVQYYTDAANSIISTFQLINDAKIQALDFELQVTQSRIIAATELAKRGNTEVLANELNNLNKLQEERERIANKQLAINSLLQASGAALATVQSFQAVANAAATGDPYTGALRIAAVVAALASGFALVAGLATAARGFKDGVIGLDGAGTATSDSIHARLSKGESVITAEKTQRYRPVLEAIHAGTFERSFPVYNTNNSIEIKSVVKELKQVKEAIGNLAFNAENRLDANGLTQSISTTLTRNQNRWKRG